MLQRATVGTPRGPRGNSPSVRGGGRGGIQKRQGRTARVDKDGDLVMDAAAAGDKRRSGRGQIDGAATKPMGAGRNNSGPSRAGQSNHRAQQLLRGLDSKQANVLESRITINTATTLSIDGLLSSKAASNPDGGLESLLGFLERKASAMDAKSNRTVKIKKSSMKGGSVIITASPDDIAQIQKLDGFGFAGAILSIQPCDPLSPGKSFAKKNENVSQEAQQAKDRFKAILAARYDTGLKLLNLSALGQDVGLREMGVFDGTTTTSKVFPAMMVVCDSLFKNAHEKREAIVSVSLTDNELADVSAVTTLAQTFPDLKNLDLSRNKFSDIKGLEAWRWKFRHLENLVLAGNPIESHPTLKDELLRWYPNLQVVNGTTVRTHEDVAAAKAVAEATKSPIPISPPDFRDVSQVGENFIRQFFPLYDNDRNALLAACYDGQSVYSLSVDTSVRGRKGDLPIKPWSEYLQYSKNLKKITTLTGRMTRRYKGSQAIQELWSTLPATRHPNLATNPDKYLIECHSLPGLADPSGQSHGGVDGLIISMHGEFEDQLNSATDKSIRSFSRTFVLGPGGPNGPPIRVISDMLTLRAWSPLALPQISTLAPETQATIDPEQQKRDAITRALVEKTGMRPDYANLCLMETGYDLEKAFMLFVANKDNLPAEAFLPGATR